MSPITVAGRITRAAQSRLHRQWNGMRDQWVLTFELQPPAGPTGKPRTYRAALCFGSGNAASFVCGAKASALRIGTRVVVHAQGEDTGRGFSLLHPIDHIETPDVKLRNMTGEPA